MEIDRILVQEMINNSVGNEYQIDEIINSSKYLFITYKHRNFNRDDERGKLIGSGPIVYDKETKEYKTSGSGDFVFGKYSNYLNEKEEYIETIITFEKIREDILRREYVNLSDIDNLALLIEKEVGEINYHQTWSKDLDFTNQVIIFTDNKKALNKIIKFWEEIGFEFNLVSESEILVWRIKKTYA